MKLNGKPRAEADLPALKEYPLLGLALRAGLDSLKILFHLLGIKPFSWHPALPVLISPEIRTSLSHTQIA